MQDAKGKTLAVGQTVTFDTWDDSDSKNPKRVSNTGVITALTGESRENQTLGDATITANKKEYVVPAIATTFVK